MATPQMNYQINNTITNEELLSQQKFIEEMIRQRDIANDKILKHTIHRSESIDRPGSTNTIIENLHGIVEEISSSEIKDISEVKDILIPEVKDILIPEVKDIFIPEVKNIPKERITILENISKDKNIFITIDFAVKIVDKI